jgi:hypothetical protein
VPPFPSLPIGHIPHSAAMRSNASEGTDARMIDVRPDCLLPADQGWQQPTPDEVRAVLKAADMTGGSASKFLGLSNTRVIRRWTGGDDQIPYSAWALLCAAAGLGNMWEHQNDDFSG